MQDPVYFQTRPTTHATPTQKVALNAIERAKPEIAPQLVRASAAALVELRIVLKPRRQKTMSSTLVDGLSRTLEFSCDWYGCLIGGQLQYSVAHEAPPRFGYATRLPSLKAGQATEKHSARSAGCFSDRSKNPHRNLPSLRDLPLPCQSNIWPKHFLMSKGIDSILESTDCG